MDGLKKYNIKRLSYSTLSSFRERQDLWFLQKICGYKFPSNPAMKRGNYIEEGIHAFLSKAGKLDEVCEVTTKLLQIIVNRMALMRKKQKLKFLTLPKVLKRVSKNLNLLANLFHIKNKLILNY